MAEAKAAAPEPVLHPNFQLTDIPLFQMSPPPAAAGAPSVAPIAQLQAERPDAAAPNVEAWDTGAVTVVAIPLGRGTYAKTPNAAERQPNRTGLPHRLKANVEAMSGLSLDDVRVHRNSPKPAQLRALAYARGTEIHLGPGQERHLPHEAWHVVQQKQGRVRPTLQVRGLAISDDSSLEQEASNLGRCQEKDGAYARAFARGEERPRPSNPSAFVVQRKGSDKEEITNSSPEDETPGKADSEAAISDAEFEAQRQSIGEDLYHYKMEANMKKADNNYRDLRLAYYKKYKEAKSTDKGRDHIKSEMDSWVESQKFSTHMHRDAIMAIREKGLLLEGIDNTGYHPVEAKYTHAREGRVSYKGHRQRQLMHHFSEFLKPRLTRKSLNTNDGINPGEVQTAFDSVKIHISTNNRESQALLGKLLEQHKGKLASLITNDGQVSSNKRSTRSARKLNKFLDRNKRHSKENPEDAKTAAAAMQAFLDGNIVVEEGEEHAEVNIKNNIASEKNPPNPAGTKDRCFRCAIDLGHDAERKKIEGLDYYADGPVFFDGRKPSEYDKNVEDVLGGKSRISKETLRAESDTDTDGEVIIESHKKRKANPKMEKDEESDDDFIPKDDKKD